MRSRSAAPGILPDAGCAAFYGYTGLDLVPKNVSPGGNTMRAWFVLTALLLALPAAAEPVKMAVFDFTLLDTSPAAPSTEELARLHRLSDQLRVALAQRFTVVDAAALQANLKGQSVRGCNGCEIDIAHQLGTQQLAYGWVQKVSNLILNINVVVEDVATGKDLRAQSVDIRGNTDESWTRGLRYLLNERMFRE